MHNRRLRYRVVAAKDKSREVDIFWSRLGLFRPRKEKSKARSKERCRMDRWPVTLIADHDGFLSAMKTFCKAGGGTG
jgi:hypothetical protein